jgi:hypothetical protein
MPIQSIKQASELLSQQPVVRVLVREGVQATGTQPARTVHAVLQLWSEAGNNSFGTKKGEVLQVTGPTSAVVMTDVVAGVVVPSVSGTYTLTNGAINIPVVLPAGAYVATDSVTVAFGNLTFPNGLVVTGATATIDFD